MSELVDTTEMYLRTVFELAEDDVVPLRARLAERLSHSVPTVSQTVARMERNGLLTVTPYGDRRIELTEAGTQAALRVARKHRLAECLLVDVLGLPWTQVHEEACRWEHVLSDEAEARIHAVCGQPLRSPFGNPIPGLAELHSAGPLTAASLDPAEVMLVAHIHRTPEAQRVRLTRFGEPTQGDIALLAALDALSAHPGTEVIVGREASGVIRVRTERAAGYVDLTDYLAAHIGVLPVAP
ncbi:MAG: metal-dependent transcriptional regulator [Actinomycetales bacterium]|nr:metal-dependent transcriptional regulator [Actinomycetales bacterium]